MPEDTEKIIIPLASEEANVRKSTVVTGRVRIKVTTEEVPEKIQASLVKERAEVRRVPVGRLLEEGEAPPAPRREGEVLVLPVLEEVPVVVKRLRIVEELHIAVHQVKEEAELPARLRKQRLVVERMAQDGNYLPDPNISGASTMTVRTLTAVFSDRNDATRAVERLASAGIPRTAVRILPEGDTEQVGDGYDDSGHQGFWASLENFFFPDEDRYSYAEAMNRGDIVVTASVDDSMVQTAEEILDEAGTVSMDDREKAWRSEGWNGWQGQQELASGGTAGAQGFAEAPAREGVIPLAEEELRVGKREVGRGRVKVRSYVVEEPASADVTLREEQVQLERRPVDRVVEGASADDLFRERNVEIEERGEEAVIEKRARVREEVAVGKTAEEHTEHVSDTVRRTEVEIEDERGNKKTSRP